MCLTKGDQILIKKFVLIKNLQCYKVNKGISYKRWKKVTLNEFSKQLRDTGLAEHEASGSWQRTACTDYITFHYIRVI